MTWVFGYGSLIWRPDFLYTEARDCYALGWVRRFWQGSTDHRGTETFPGRVLTLLESEGALCVGRAFHLPPDKEEQILETLDEREQGGYTKAYVDLYTLGSVEGEPSFAKALTYIAKPDNPEFLGAAPLEDMAFRIANAKGPSGPNEEYLFNFASSMEAMGIREEHTVELCKAVEEYKKKHDST